MESSVKVVGTLRLILKSSFCLELKNTFYIPTFPRNLISIVRLVSLEYKFVFEQTTCNIYKNNNFIGSCVLFNSLYKLNLDPTFESNIFTLHDEILALSVLLLMRIPLNFGIGDYDISPQKELKS